MAGRKPLPTELKEILGNPGHRPMNPNEPRPEPEMPDCPAHISEVAKAEWARVAPRLLRLGILAEIDSAALAGYCEAYASWVDAVEKLRQFGKIVKAPKSGHPMPNPYVSIANQSLDHMRKFMQEFGMTPSSRSRIVGTAGGYSDRESTKPTARFFPFDTDGPSKRVC